MDWGLFLGRFHPVVVHLPIGILLLAVFMELYSRYKGTSKFQSAISFSLFWGSISGIIAVILGFLISSQGNYAENTLSWHRIWGILIVALSLLSWISKNSNLVIFKTMYLPLFFTLAVSILVTGHLGGTLTHGNNYLLRNAPAFVKKIFQEDIIENRNVISDSIIPDSVILYTHLIDPIISNKCATCHNQSRRKGGLDLTNYDRFISENKHDDILIAGDPYKSQLFQRVILPQSSEKFMPLKGTPLSYGEIRIIEWWIKGGASDTLRLTDNPIPTDIQHILLKDYRFDVSPRRFVEIIDVPPLKQKELEILEQNHFSVKYLARNIYFIDVRSNNIELNHKNLEALKVAEHQVTWLDLRNSGITDDLMVLLSDFTNLTILNLGQNPISDKGLEAILDLEHLEILNLYGTKVTDKWLDELVDMPALKKLYVANTNIEEIHVDEVERLRPNLEIIQEVRFSDLKDFNLNK